jgi:hypothetical protein
MGTGSAQNGCPGAVDDIRPKFTLCGSFTPATWRMTSAPFALALAPLLLDMLMMALKGRHRGPGYVLLFLLLLVVLLVV